MLDDGQVIHQDIVLTSLDSLRDLCHTKQQPVNKSIECLVREGLWRSHLIVILRGCRGHVLEMLLSHVHVLDWTVGGARVGVDPHALHLLYW